MKAIRYTNMTRSQRETVNTATEFVMLAALVVLHDDFGFGADRATRFVNATSAVLDEYSDRYGADSLLQALRSKAKEKGIEIE